MTLFRLITGYNNVYQWHYRRNYLRSPAWARTKAKRKKGYCAKCGTRNNLDLHHLDYSNTPKFHWRHLLPFARFFMWRVDTKSKMVTLCHKHHMMAHISKVEK